MAASQGNHSMKNVKDGFVKTFKWTRSIFVESKISLQNKIVHL